jgi:hypothetical protein
VDQGLQVLLQLAALLQELLLALKLVVAVELQEGTAAHGRLQKQAVAQKAWSKAAVSSQPSLVFPVLRRWRLGRGACVPGRCARHQALGAWTQKLRHCPGARTMESLLQQLHWRMGLAAPRCRPAALTA